MSRLIFFSFFGYLAACMAGCGSFSTKSSSQKNESRRVLSLSQELKRQKSLVEELRERNLVLERKLAGGSGKDSSSAPNTTDAKSDYDPVPVPFEPSAALERRLPDPIPELQVPSVTTSEQQMYSKLAESYRRHDELETEKNLNLFLKIYPDSAFADNALYQTGLLAFENSNLERAERYMNRVLNEFPRGNKVVSALFAKAMIEKRKQRFLEARRLLNEVRQAYPGSPEANRVTVELKILDLSARKPRES